MMTNEKAGNKKFAGIAVLLFAAAAVYAGYHYVLHNSRSEIKHFTAFMAVPGEEKAKDNRIKNKIAELTGARAEVEWLGGQTPQEKIETMIKTGNILIF